MENQGEEIPLIHLMPLMQRVMSLAELHKKFGITKSQLVIYLVLYYMGSATMTEIAQYISSSKEQATRAVSALCDNGTVERYENRDNRTHVHLRLSDAGLAYIQNIISELRSEVNNRLSSGLSTEDIEKLKESVRTTVEILGKLNFTKCT